MSARVVLARSCCAGPAAHEDAAAAVLSAVARQGRKAVLLPRAGHGSRPDGEQDVPDTRPTQLARALGLCDLVVRAGCPVPFLDVLRTWSAVLAELDADRWDAVVLQAGDTSSTLDLLDGPRRLLGVLDARLDDLGATGAPDVVADLLALRSRTARMRSRLDEAGVFVAGGCSEPAAPLLALPVLDPDDPFATGGQTQGVRVEGDGWRWWLRTSGPVDAQHVDEPRVEAFRVGDELLEVSLGGLSRTFRLPAALGRCVVTGARMSGGVLEIGFEPDVERWRWS